jgi:xanthine/uracil/vitamin C permease (AzgA family)
MCLVLQVRQAVPAFITIVVMPLTYSIAYGVIAGEPLIVGFWGS